MPITYLLCLTKSFFYAILTWLFIVDDRFDLVGEESPNTIQFNLKMVVDNTHRFTREGKQGKVAQRQYYPDLSGER